MLDQNAFLDIKNRRTRSIAPRAPTGFGAWLTALFLSFGLAPLDTAAARAQGIPSTPASGAADVQAASKRQAGIAAEAVPAASPSAFALNALYEARLAAEDEGDETDPKELDGRIAAMRRAIAAGEGNPSDVLLRSAEREGIVRRRLEAARRRLDTAELQAQAMQNRFAQQARPSAQLFDEAEALSVRRDAIRQEMALAERQLERIPVERELWQTWERLLRGTPGPQDLEPGASRATEHGQTLEQAQVRTAGRLSDLRSRLEGLDRRRAVEPEDRIRKALDEQTEALRHLQAAMQADAEAMAADHRFTGRVLEDIQERKGSINPFSYVVEAAKAVRDVWSYQITSVDEAPITVGSLISALVLFLVGMWGARRGSSIVGRVAEHRFSLHVGAAHALQTMSFYALLVGFSLLALRVVHFPLTAFTVLGGALAIGVGFGSQNVMNNFISGLILMLERPIRAQDMVEVDSNHGTVERIGARSTLIRSVDGRQIVVPNSFFLENNVINWTLSDELIRTHVLVGVIYGSPTRLVEKLIRQVVDEDERVLKQPEPIILFDEFGDNSLNFDVHFWVKARTPMEMRKIQSRIRFRIDDLFRQNQLVIAFPQRDVHLDCTSPIEVRVQNVPEDETPS